MKLNALGWQLVDALSPVNHRGLHQSCGMAEINKTEVW